MALNRTRKAVHSRLTGADYWADWLLDAVACATQDRRLLRGEPEEDKVLTEAILLNGKKAIESAIKEHIAAIKEHIAALTCKR